MVVGGVAGIVVGVIRKVIVIVAVLLVCVVRKVMVIVAVVLVCCCGCCGCCCSRDYCRCCWLFLLVAVVVVTDVFGAV